MKLIDFGLKLVKVSQLLFSMPELLKDDLYTKLDDSTPLEIGFAKNIQWVLIVLLYRQTDSH